jgi:predicted nucleic acid-binding protein
VLRSLYGLGRQAIARALAALATLPQVHCEDAASITEALAWLRQGLDFADALHLASSRATERFATFDRKLLRRARVAATSVVVPAP